MNEVAVTVAWWVPVLPAGGETAIVEFTDPVPVPGGFRVANDGSDAVRVIKAPGVPVAATGTEMEAPSANVTSSIGVMVTVGALLTRICVTADPDDAFAASKETSYSPSCPVTGVQLNTPRVFVPFGVNALPKGRSEALRDAMASPSGSLALTVKLRLEPVTPSSRAGAVTMGAWFWPALLTVMSKVRTVETPPAIAQSMSSRWQGSCRTPRSS